MRIVGWMGLAIVVIVVGLLAYLFVSVYLWPGIEEGRRLDALKREAILTSPPAGFTPIGELGVHSGNDGVTFGHRLAGNVDQVFTSEMTAPDALNAWADQLTAEGWTMRSQTCPTPGIQYAGLGATKRVEGFTASASVTIDSSGVAGLRLTSPDDGRSSLLGDPPPEPQRC